MTLLLFTAGLVLLVVGAEALVRGASQLAKVVGLSPLIIGLTIVAYGTSAPEMAVSVLAGLAGNADISLGNVVGSNIFNVLLILGVSSLITPLIASAQLVRLDVPIMIAASILTWILGADGKVGRSDGILLFAGIIIYTVFLIYQGRKENKKAPEDKAQTSNDQKSFFEGTLLVNIALIVSGLALLVLGSHWLVKGAVSIAQYLGVSQLLIGLTVVAAGTSLPEVATSVVAAIRGERDIAVGNVVGSNIFNIMAVLGMSAIVSSEGITISDIALRFDIPVMTAVAVACLPIFFTGNVISRWEGGPFPRILPGIYPFPGPVRHPQRYAAGFQQSHAVVYHSDHGDYPAGRFCAHHTRPAKAVGSLQSSLVAGGLMKHSPETSTPGTSESSVKGVVRSLGLVFGDIGTSPIYTLSVIFLLTKPSADHVIGVLSLIIWTLVTLVSVEYAWLAMVFLIAGFYKLPNGGYWSLILAAIPFSVILIYTSGQRRLYRRLSPTGPTRFLERYQKAYSTMSKIEGTGLFFVRDISKIPPYIIHTMFTNNIIYTDNIFVSVIRLEDPFGVSGAFKEDLASCPQ